MMLSIRSTLPAGRTLPASRRSSVCFETAPQAGSRKRAWLDPSGGACGLFHAYRTECGWRIAFLRQTLATRNKILVFTHRFPEIPSFRALNAGPVIFISAVYLSQCQPTMPLLDRWDDQRHAGTESRMSSEQMFVERAGDVSHGFVATDCFRIVTGLIVQHTHSVQPTRGLTATVGIQN